MFALQARDVERMRDYKAALARFNEIKADRYGYKYLSRNKSLCIHKYTSKAELVNAHNLYAKRGDELDGAIVCSYNEHPVVKYYPDGRIALNACSWVTPSTCTFIYACTGISCGITRNKMYVCAKHEPDGETGYYVFGNPVLKDGVILNPTQEQRKVVDKPKAAAIRARYKAFQDEVCLLASATTVSEELVRRWKLRLGVVYKIDTTNFTLRDMAASFEDEREIVTTYFLLAGASTATPWPFPPTSEQFVTSVKKIFTKMYRALYEADKAWVYEDVPLGEIALPDTI